jgi:hypothetical protein
MKKLRKVGAIIDALCAGHSCSECKIEATCSKYHGVSVEWPEEELDAIIREYGVKTEAGPPDNVNSPKHYALPGGLEVIDVEVATQGREAVQNHCICTALEYLLRSTRKNGAEDVEKARWWLNKWHELREGEPK